MTIQDKAVSQNNNDILPQYKELSKHAFSESVSSSFAIGGTIELPKEQVCSHLRDREMSGRSSIPSLNTDCKKDRYRMHWFRPEALHEDVIKEFDALNEKNYKTCIVQGVITRVRRVASCLLLTPLTFMLSPACCFCGACCCICGALTISCAARNKRIENLGDGCINTSIAAFGCSLAGCGVFLMQVFCCPPNVIFPELFDPLATKAEQKIERLEEDSWKIFQNTLNRV